MHPERGRVPLCCLPPPPSYTRKRAQQTGGVLDPTTFF